MLSKRVELKTNNTSAEIKKEHPVQSALKKSLLPPLIDLVNQYRIPTAASLLEDFNRPDSRVAFALEELTEEESAAVFSSLPLPLKFYYYPKEAFQTEMVKPENQGFRQALAYGLLHHDFKQEPKYRQSYINILLSKGINFSKNKKDFEELCSTYNPALIHALKIRYAGYATAGRSAYGSLVSDGEMFSRFFVPLIRESNRHLNLPFCEFDCIHMEDLDLQGANLKGAVFDVIMRNVNFSGADLRGARLRSLNKCNFRNADLTDVRPVRTLIFENQGSDFLGAIVDKETKKIIQETMEKAFCVLAYETPIFKPLHYFFGDTFQKHTTFTFFNKTPSWDMCVHLARLMGADNGAEFATYRRDIPKELMTPAFQIALDKVANNFFYAAVVAKKYHKP